MNKRNKVNNMTSDRDSIYLDTLSIRSVSTINSDRKSLALSRQTVYHSAEDIQSLKSGFGSVNGIGAFLNSQRFHSDGGLDEADQLATEASIVAHKYQRQANETDEVSELLLSSTSTTYCPLNKNRKPIITYKQWKSRVKPKQKLICV